MVTLDILGQVYAVSATVGTAFLALSILSGRIGHGHGTGHSGFGHHGAGHGTAAGHGGVAHGGSHGGHAGSHPGGHTGGAGHASARVGGIGQDATHAAMHGAGATHVGNHGIAHGHSQAVAGTSSNSQSNTNNSWSGKDGASLARSGPFRLAHIHSESKEEEWAERIFCWINPFFLAIFFSFFGLTGLILTFANKSLGVLTLIPSIAIGLAANWILKAFIRWMFEKLESSSSAVVAELIGQPAAVSVPIAPARTGEITYIVQSKRYNLPAKAFNPSAELLRGTKVIISDLRENIAYVEPWTDSFEPGFQEILPTMQVKEQHESSGQDTGR